MKEKLTTNEERKLYETEQDRMKAQADSMQRELLQNCKSEYNMEMFRKHLNSYRMAGAAPATIRNHISSLNVWNIPYDIDKMTKSELEEMLMSMEERDLSPQTKKSHKINLKCLLKYAGREDLSDTIKINNRRSTTKLPDDLLSKDDISKLIDNALNPRDKALISLLYESGARLGEMLSLRLKHIEPHEKGTYIHFPEGKTGARKILVVFSGMYLNNWLITHPERNNREAYVWCQLQPPHKQLSFGSFRTVLKKAAKRAGIQKKVNPHSFRHAQATELAKDFTEQQMKNYLGWVQESKMAATYVHLSGRDMDAAVLAKNGIEIDKRDTRLKPSECPRCHKMIPPNAVYCGFCGLPLTGEATDENKKALENLLQGLKAHPEILLELAGIKKE